MKDFDDFSAPSRKLPDSHQRNEKKLSRIPIKVDTSSPTLKKPDWIRVRLGNPDDVKDIKRILRNKGLHSVCEEAACPNLSECFSQRTATFMILGDICTRRCPFCDVAHGRPKPPDPNEPEHLGKTIAELRLRYVVITSVDRDDLRDGGAEHFSDCIRAIRQHSPTTRIEILTPDFRGRQDIAFERLNAHPPDVFNHNLETVPRLYKAARPGADYQVSLQLLHRFKLQNPEVPTKSGLMLGLGETLEEIHSVLHDLRSHGCDMLTVGQYLQPSHDHFPVQRYATPQEFKELEDFAYAIGFTAVASAPMVRSSYHADLQAEGLLTHP
jgi:lipoic acid synthetase